MRRYIAYYNKQIKNYDTVEEGQKFILSSLCSSKTHSESRLPKLGNVLLNVNYSSEDDKFSYGVLDLYYMIPYATLKDIEQNKASVSFRIDSDGVPSIFLRRPLGETMKDPLFFNAVVDEMPKSIYSSHYNMKHIVSDLAKSNYNYKILYPLSYDEHNSFAIAVSCYFEKFFNNGNYNYIMKKDFHKAYKTSRYCSMAINLNKDINSWDNKIFKAETINGVVNAFSRWNKKNNEVFSEYLIRELSDRSRSCLNICGAEAASFIDFYDIIPDYDKYAIADDDNPPTSIEWFFENVPSDYFKGEFNLEVGIHIVRNTGVMDKPMICEMLIKHNLISSGMTQDDIDELIDSYLNKQIDIKYKVYENNAKALPKAIDKLFE